MIEELELLNIFLIYYFFNKTLVLLKNFCIRKNIAFLI